MSIKAIGIDLAKSVFQVCVLQEDGSILWNRKVKREKLLHTLRNFPAKTLVAMECSGLMIPDTKLGGKVTAVNEVFNDKTTTTYIFS